MDELKEVLDMIDASFLLENNEKVELKRFIRHNREDYKLKELRVFIDERVFVNKFLKSLLKQDTENITHMEIRNNMKMDYLKYIKQLEVLEEENLDKIFANLI